MNWKQPKVYAVKHRNESVIAASRSGGIFTALSDQVLSTGGVVYTGKRCQAPLKKNKLSKIFLNKNRNV